MLIPLKLNVLCGLGGNWWLHNFIFFLKIQMREDPLLFSSLCFRDLKKKKRKKERKRNTFHLRKVVPIEILVLSAPMSRFSSRDYRFSVILHCHFYFLVTYVYVWRKNWCCYIEKNLYWRLHPEFIFPWTVFYFQFSSSWGWMDISPPWQKVAVI